MAISGAYLLIVALSVAVAVAGYRALSFRRRQLLRSSWRRAWRWEFWPMPVFYSVPLVAILALIVRYRGLTFTAASPALPDSGFTGEHKSRGLGLFAAACPEAVAEFRVLDGAMAAPHKAAATKNFMASIGTDYPVVLKPDNGQRGAGVKVVRSDAELEAYLATARGDTICQRWIGGLEYGVFYIREPDQPRGFIYSITAKQFPRLSGDGRKTLAELICDDSRAHYMARFLFALHARRLEEVWPFGHTEALVEIGSHCRGSLFVDGGHLRSDALEHRLHAICSAVDGFCFGRFDIRVPDEAAFQRGEGLQILEVNGVTSEATHMYDPRYGVIAAWKTLCGQWRWAFEVGQQNINRGYRGAGIGDLWRRLRAMQQF